jgi:hypothetical protein
MDTGTASIIVAGITSLASMVTGITVALIASRKREYGPAPASAPHDTSERRRAIVRGSLIIFLYSYGGLLLAVGLWNVMASVVFEQYLPLKGGFAITLAIFIAMGLGFVCAACLTKKWWPKPESLN